MLGGACGTDEGQCAMGTEACVNGRYVCQGEGRPAPETCDCEDNDCDGATDEGCPPPCDPSTEVCNDRDDDCDGTVDEGCLSGCAPENEVCDGEDNDCDVMVDEGCPGPI